MDQTTQTLSRYATSLRYADLSPRTIQEAKRHLIDSLGCAMGGYGSEPAAIARRVSPAWSGAHRLGSWATGDRRRPRPRPSPTRS